VPDDQVDADLQFANLKAFYQSRLSETNTSLRGLPLHDGLGFSSPAALTRIMSLYTGRGHQGRLQQGPADIMREALGTNDGLKIANLDESKEIKKLISGGWDATASLEQRKEQTEPIRFEDELVVQHVATSYQSQRQKSRLRDSRLSWLPKRTYPQSRSGRLTLPLHLRLLHIGPWCRKKHR
jgi:dynactin-4